MPRCTRTPDGASGRDRGIDALGRDALGRDRGLGRPGLLSAVAVMAMVAAIGWAWWAGGAGGLTLPIREQCAATVHGDTAEVDPEQAGNAALIAAIAVRRGLPARAASIGIATAIQESKLRNIDYGDRDSLGLFQQRPSQGWGTREEVLDPVHATNAFFDALVRVEGYEQMPITEVAQAVQKSAFPSAYADHEPEARLLASALSGYSPAAFACTLRPAAPSETRAGNAAGRDVVRAARVETGRARPTSVDGSVLRYSLEGPQARRLAWALAQWAVARADGLGIVAVEVDGRRWSAGDREPRWAASDTAPGPREVVLRVAG